MTLGNDNTPAIRAHGLSKSFGQLQALRDLSFQVPRGAVLGFLGPNSAGKTTTLKLLMGLLRRDAGETEVLGCDPAWAPLTVRSRVGYVPEQHFVFRWMRVADAVHFCRTWYPSWNDGRCGELMRLLDLDPNQRVKHLSKGSATKLALLLAMAHDPELLILDEPMAGLDPVVREELLDAILQTLCDGKRSMLISSHTLPDVQRLADHVAIIDQGQLLVQRSVDDLLRETKRIRMVLPGQTAPPVAPEGMLWQRVQNREWLLTVGNFSPTTVEALRARNRVEHVEVMDLALEDVFKDYIRSRRKP